MTDELTFDLADDELEIFLADANECFQAMESGILNLEREADKETLHAIFRAAHTLKALAGTIGHRPMAELTHAVETLFGEMREGNLSSSPVLIDELLAIVDVLKAFRKEIITRQSSGVEMAPHLVQLQLLQSSQSQPQPSQAQPLISPQLSLDQRAEAQNWLDQGHHLLEIEVTAQSQAFAPAARLYQASLALLEVGQIISQQPALELMGDEDKHMWLILATLSETEVINNLLRDIADLAEVRVQTYTLTGEEQPAHVSPTESSPPPAKTQPAVSSNGPERARDKTVRISVERLDTLLNLVGELVTNRTRLLQIEEMLQAQYGKGEAVSALSELTPHFSHVVSQLQEEVMRVRMLPIATLFNRFPRLVREAARSAGKQVDLMIEGEATELDRAVMEAIGDPLIHLLRNAVDHGLETPEARLAAGKPAAGTIRLTATAAEGQIIITVADDGRGIDPVQIRQAAVARGLLTPDEVAQLSDDEAVDLIFRPNLSTASQVTEVSGRGVGMDVVRTNIERLSGSVVVTNQPGRGVTFHLTLPLTLALVQTMLVSVQGNLYAIPLTSINGALYLAEANLHTVKNQPILDWQGATLPLLDLRQFFTHPRLGNTSPNEVKSTIILVTWGKLRAGLIVDKIVGQQEIVVKALSAFIGHMPGLSGATILGDGRIAFIVDIPSLMNTALQARRQGEI